MLKTIAQCLGLASLVLLENYHDMLGGGGIARMHVPFALGGVIAANLLDIVLLTAALTLILLALKPTRFYPTARLLLILLVPLYFLFRFNSLMPSELPQGSMSGLPLLWLVVILFLFFHVPAWYRRLMVLGSWMGMSFAVFAVFSMLQLLATAAWQPGPYQHEASWSRTEQPPRVHPRLVWVLFDELSYDQLFGRRAAGLSLPSFDTLRSVSTLYVNSRPIGFHTVSIVPSLLSGHVSDDYRFRWGNRLDLHFAGMPGWHQADGTNSIFGDAQRLGWRTAVVGWYNPYCSIYASAVDDCYWMNRDKIEGPMAQDRTLWQNTWAPLAQIGRRAISPQSADRNDCNFEVNQRLQTYLDLEAHMLQVLKTDQADLIFLHFAIPHSPAIWNRVNKGYRKRCGGSYLDNLALADVELGKVLALLRGSSRWSDTTLIVQGDHSWRTILWRSLPAWTSEDEAASRSTFDPRPAVIIHSPGETAPQTNESAWSILNVHEVVEETLHNQR